MLQIIRGQLFISIYLIQFIQKLIPIKAPMFQICIKCIKEKRIHPIHSFIIFQEIKTLNTRILKEIHPFSNVTNHGLHTVSAQSINQ